VLRAAVVEIGRIRVHTRPTYESVRVFAWE
jgi:hypothetical protein